MMTNDVILQPRSRRRPFLKWLTVAATALATVTVTTSVAAGSGHDERNDDHERGAYAIGLWGDLPYSDLQATVGVPNLIADMNRQDLEFTVHDGDLKAGSGVAGTTTPSTCSDALYLQSLGYLNSLRAPAMFSPGDNDWTECDRPANGGFSRRRFPLANIGCGSTSRPIPSAKAWRAWCIASRIGGGASAA